MGLERTKNTRGLNHSTTTTTLFFWFCWQHSATTTMIRKTHTHTHCLSFFLSFSSHTLHTQQKKMEKQRKSQMICSSPENNTPKTILFETAHSSVFIHAWISFSCCSFSFLGSLFIKFYTYTTWFCLLTGHATSKPLCMSCWTFFGNEHDKIKLWLRHYQLQQQTLGKKERKSQVINEPSFRSVALFRSCCQLERRWINHFGPSLNRTDDLADSLAIQSHGYSRETDWKIVVASGLFFNHPAGRDWKG